MRDGHHETSWCKLVFVNLPVSALPLIFQSQHVGFPSDRPSRIHDPSDIRDKSLTNLLTTVVKERSRRDEMMTQGEPGRQPPCFKIKMCHRVRYLLRRDTSFAPMKPRKVRQLLRERHREEINVSGSPTLHRAKPLTRNLKTPADEENARDWSERDRDATSSTDGDAETKKKQKRLERSARGRARAIAKAGEDPTLANLSFLGRVSVCHGIEAKYKKQVDSSSV